jgi:hypothetical protein
MSAGIGSKSFPRPHDRFATYDPVSDTPSRSNRMSKPRKKRGVAFWATVGNEEFAAFVTDDPRNRAGQLRQPLSAASMIHTSTDWAMSRSANFFTR